MNQLDIKTEVNDDSYIEFEYVPSILTIDARNIKQEQEQTLKNQTTVDTPGELSCQSTKSASKKKKNGFKNNQKCQTPSKTPDRYAYRQILRNLEHRRLLRPLPKKCSVCQKSKFLCVCEF